MKILPIQGRPNNLGLKKERKKRRRRFIHLRTRDKTNPKNQVKIVGECTLLILSSSPLKYFSNKRASFELAKLPNSYNNSLY